MNVNKIILFLISIFFILFKFINTKILNTGSSMTLPGYLLQKLPYNFLRLYLKNIQAPVILVTGTNGKTSTTSLINHLLTSNNHKVLSNYTGSNLVRGILSTLVLSYPKYILKNPDFLLFEVDEASVEEVIKSFPKNHYKKSLILLNLSRDQLDRYGEVDTLAKKINTAINNSDFKLFLKKGKYISFFKNYILVTKQKKLNYTNKLKISKTGFLNDNLDFIIKVFNELGINIKTIKPFSPVAGRGKVFTKDSINYTLTLSKNPKSFDLNLKELKTNTLIIYLNDNIPDGRDVSWFYDINVSLLKKQLKNKKVFIVGTRSYDFYNLLNIYNINCFNFVNIKDAHKYLGNTFTQKVTILANYSAMQESINYLNKNV